MKYLILFIISISVYADDDIVRKYFPKSGIPTHGYSSIYVSCEDFILEYKPDASQKFLMQTCYEALSKTDWNYAIKNRIVVIDPRCREAEYKANLGYGKKKAEIISITMCNLLYCDLDAEKRGLCKAGEDLKYNQENGNARDKR